MRSLPSAGLLALLVLVASGAEAREAKPQPLPASDPPAVLGAPLVIDGVAIQPVDGPFDDAGYAGLDAEAGASVSAAHRTLPLPSYVEVTELDAGRTILVRVERRGPRETGRLIDLSPAAFAQLGADPATPLAVRVRRVSPQEYERALLRTGQRAPERLATPKQLLEVLRRKLASRATPATVPAVAAVSTPPAAAAPAKAAPRPAEAAKPPAPPSGGLAVQVAAFASRERATATAGRLGGKVAAAGRLWRVRLGPFASRGEADAALARARKAGFADARIVTASR